MSECECKNTVCNDSRKTEYGYTRRRRECIDCGRRFSTIETEVDMRGGHVSALANLREKFGGLTIRQQKAIQEMINAFQGDE